MAWSRSACCPVRPNRARSAPRGWTGTKAVGAIGRGDIDRLPEKGDGLVQVHLPSVRSNRVRNAPPRLDNIAGRPALLAATAPTASRRRAMAWSRSGWCPVRSNRVPSAVPRLDSIAGRPGSRPRRHRPPRGRWRWRSGGAGCSRSAGSPRTGRPRGRWPGSGVAGGHV